MTSQAKGTPSSSEYAAYYYHLYFPDAASSADHTIRSYQINSARKQLKALDKLVEQLVNNAVADGDDPPLFSSDFDSLVRGRKGYFIVAVTGAEFDGDDPIAFTLAHSSTGAAGNGSHTFDFVKNFSKTVGAVKVSVAVYYDRMQSAAHPHQNLAIREWEHFRLTYRFKMPRRIDLDYEDSGGVNMGPPPAPPGLHGMSA